MKYTVKIEQFPDGRQEFFRIISEDGNTDIILVGGVDIVDLRPRKDLTTAMSTIQSIQGEENGSNDIAHEV